MRGQSAQGNSAMQAFMQLDLDAHLSTPVLDPWPKVHQLVDMALDRVPAYPAYLERLGHPLEGPKTWEAFERLPLMTKKDYIQGFPLEARVESGDLSLLDRLAVSSGSTGVPTFWPRAERHEFAIAVRFEQVFRDSFRAHERKTLAVVCFALGNWVGGFFTTSCCWHLARKGYPLTVATPGNNVAEILRVVSALGPAYEQVVLLGYPPFVRDVVDQGRVQGIDWGALQTRMVFAGEVFSEEWRSDIVQRAGGTAPHLETASLYGTADGGVLGNETPYSTLIRAMFAQKPKAARALFGESRLPTLVQYDPRDRYFEMHEGTLVVTGENGVPLVRYHIADRGGLIPFDAMEETLEALGVRDEIRAQLGSTTPIRPLPFVYVFGRADFTVSFYGANVYPENVTVGLEQPEFRDVLTGKFVLESVDGSTGNPELLVTVELRPGETPPSGLESAISGRIQAELMRLNSEFAHYVPKDRQIPRVVLKPFGDPEDFPLGIKHRYTRGQTL